MEFLIFIICLLASAVGGICGIGGGVIIKPVLDAMNLMSVSAISFLTGLTVLSMSVISVFMQKNDHTVEIKVGSLLALGSVGGGLVGNMLFQGIKTATGNDQIVGAVQSVVLAIITLLTLVYSSFFKHKLPSYHVHSPVCCLMLGAGMGVLSAFLGIGGGPINLAILYLAFSMDTKKAAANSLYIIVFSQASNFLMHCVRRTIPEFEWRYLVIMVVAGIAGGFIGSAINRKISSNTTEKLFAGLMCIIIFICIYNTFRLV